MPGSLTYRTYGYLMVAYAAEKRWGAAIELALVREGGMTACTAATVRTLKMLLSNFQRLLFNDFRTPKHARYLVLALYTRRATFPRARDKIRVFFFL